MSGSHLSHCNYILSTNLVPFIFASRSLHPRQRTIIYCECRLFGAGRFLGDLSPDELKNASLGNHYANLMHRPSPTGDLRYRVPLHL